MSAPVYITAPDGTRYRVYDTAWKDGKRVAANPPAEWATTRVFIGQDGTRRFYPLAFLELYPEETREPTPERLTWQLARSERGGPLRAQSLAARAAEAPADA